MSAGNGGIFEKSTPELAAAKKALLAAEGDHLTYLKVYKEWVAEHKSERWCRENGVLHRVLHDSSALLAKIHRSMGSAVPPVPLLDGKQRGGKEALLRALVSLPYSMAMAAAMN